MRGALQRPVDHPQIIALGKPACMASSVWQKAVGRVTEAMLFQVIGEQRRIAETARKQTRAAKLDNEFDARQSKKHRCYRVILPARCSP